MKVDIVQYKKIPWFAGYTVVFNGNQVGSVWPVPSARRWLARPYPESSKTKSDKFSTRGEAATYILKTTNPGWEGVAP